MTDIFNDGLDDDTILRERLRAAFALESDAQYLTQYNEAAPRIMQRLRELGVPVAVTEGVPLCLRESDPDEFMDCRGLGAIVGVTIEQPCDAQIIPFPNRVASEGEIR